MSLTQKEFQWNKVRTINEILGEEKLEDFLMKGAFDPIYWIERVFGFQLTWFAKEWIREVQHNRFINLLAFRGSSKSTVMAVWFPMWLCWYKNNLNILLTSDTYQHSLELMSRFKDTIEQNELLMEMKPSERETTWKADQIKTTSRCDIFCRAFKKSIAGIRTDYVIVDESDKCVDDESHSIFHRVIEPTGDLRNATIVSITTPENGLAGLSQELKNNKHYVTLEYPLLMKGKSIWPEEYPDNKIEEIRERMGESAFQQEYLLNAKAQTEGALFPPELIAKCLDYEIGFTSEDLGGTRILAADFAIAAGPRADYDAYVIVEKIASKTVIKYAERHRGFPVPAKSQRVKELYDLHTCEQIIIDPSHVGAAVKNDLIEMGLPVCDAEMHSKGRSNLLINLRRMLDNKELVIPFDQGDDAARTFTTVLISELVGFKETKSTATGMLIYKSTAIHDDYAISLAMAAKTASNKHEFVDMVAF